MDATAALGFVEAHGVVLVAARGPVPRLTEAIVGEPIRGSWWGHPRGKEIYAVLGQVLESPEVLVCRAVEGHQTVVHARLHAALVRAAEVLDVERLSLVADEHTPAGHHARHVVPFPQWVDEPTGRAARAMTLDDALDALGPWSRADATGR